MGDVQRFEEALPCRDAGGRLRTFSVVTTGLDEVAIIVPPGGSARITADQVEAACTALMKARSFGIRGQHI